MSFVIAGNSASTGYNLTRSLRFRASASATLSKTFAGAGDQKTFTISNWLKRGQLAIDATFFASVTDANNFLLIYYQASTDKIIILGYASAAQVVNVSTSAVFRDPSAWYHVVIAFDTTQATGSNRVKIYINNTQQTVTFTTTPSLNLNALPSTTRYIGRAETAANYFDGYLAEVNFIDGQALTPSSFGSTNALTGVWQPARYTGSYGTNGFYLPFTDNSALTTASNVGLGKDFSGNANYWVTNNISITAGVTYDSMTDVPTLTSATAANFATLNPLQLPSATLSNGNLTASGGSAFSISTIGMSSGKYYAEMTVTTVGGESSCGISQGGYTTQTGTAVGTTLNGGATAYGYLNDGSKFSNGVNPAYGSSFTTGDVIGIAFDATAGTLTFYKNNTSQGSAYTGLTSGPYFFAIEGRVAGGTNNCSINFGQRPFSYTPPTGFVALNTYNLSDSTIVKGNTVMDATTYTGNGSSQSITNSGSFKPDFVWIKNRNNVRWHILTDSVRGTNSQLFSNDTAAQETRTDRLTAFNSNGFSVGSYTDVNLNADTFVGWQWQAGQGSTSSNTNGTITSTVSVNASAGFSVVTYTTPASGGFTVGHGLGVAPAFVIHKSRSNVIGWQCYHQAIGNTAYINLDLTNASAASSTAFNNTSPSSSIITYGNTSFWGASYTYVAYAWTPIAGFSAFGSYTGNGSTDGPFVYTGFRPKFILIKRSDTAGNYWRVWDSTRATYNAGLPVLYPNVSDAEDSVTDVYDLLSNGFKLRTSAAGTNASSSTYIYAAYAENPFKNSLAR